MCVYYEYCVWCGAFTTSSVGPFFRGGGVFCVREVTVLFRCAPLDVLSIHTPKYTVYTVRALYRLVKHGTRLRSEWGRG